MMNPLSRRTVLAFATVLLAGSLTLTACDNVV